MKWTKLIHPESANVILGKRRAGKSGLAYYLMEELGAAYSLQPCVVNFPRSKLHLLPSNFAAQNLDDGIQMNDAIVLVDEGTTQLPAGQRKLEELVKGAQALCGQRNQVIIFVFHASSDVGSRILRGLDAIIAKEPSTRQIQWGSKDDYFRDFLEQAKSVLSTRGKQFSYVDCEDREVRAIVRNPLPSFWSEELSRVWAGVTGDTDYNMNDDTLFEPYEDKYLATELRDKARAGGLSPTGTKRELIAHLLHAHLL
jgi:hypothetical protein